MKNKVKYRIYIITALLILEACISTLVCQVQEKAPAPKTYTVGLLRNIFVDVDINDAQAAVKLWFTEIVKTFKYNDEYRLKALIYNDFSNLDNEIKNDSLAVLGINTIDYFTYANKFDLEPVFVPSLNGEVGNEYYILIRKDRKFQNIKDLKGTSIGVLSSRSQIASSLWLDVILAQNKLPGREKFFNKVTATEKESQLILNLFFGQLDACIVTKNSYLLMKELNPQIGEKLTYMLKSPKYVWAILCYTKTFKDTKDRKKFYTSALNVQELISGKQLLTLLKIEKLVPCQNEYLNNYKTLLKDYNNLLGKKIIVSK